MVALYTATVFVSAALLFLVQPMFAKMLLPALGGTPAVWNTCMLFFQAMLLAGYGYAHLVTSRLMFRWQVAVHAAVLLLALFTLPLAAPAGWSPPTEHSPAGWLLAVLAVSVGPAFFVVATTNPLLQRWFSWTGHARAHDPYFLYAASNLGSMLALLAYPFAIETTLRLDQQSAWWSAAYGALVLLVVGCGYALLRSQRLSASAARQEPRPPDWPERPSQNSPGQSEASPWVNEKQDPQALKGPDTLGSRTLTSSATRRYDRSMGDRLRWVALSFIPSSHLLGVTAYITSEVASLPLLWIIPLGLYLLTFILVYAERALLPRALMARLLVWLVLPLALVMTTVPGEKARWVALTLHLATFFVAAMVCHGRLADERPHPTWLTQYYFLISLGGVLGGVFNALLAPVLFTRIIEYPLILVLACLALPRRGAAINQSRSQRDVVPGDLGWPVLLFGFVTGLIVVMPRSDELEIGWKLLLFAAPAMACFTFADRPIRFALGIAVLLAAGGMEAVVRSTVLHAERSFFGVHRVRVDAAGRFVQLEHGVTIHGLQSLDPATRREPMSYYHRSGPVGDVFDSHPSPSIRGRVAIIGLGCGDMAGYLRPADRFTFFEIDPAVKRIAEDPRLFTFLSDRPAGAEYEIVLGDGRSEIAKRARGEFGIIVLDAFSSDAVPVHLLTLEAFRVYVDKLMDGGVILANISSRYVDLEPVFGSVARANGLACLFRNDRSITTDEVRAGKLPSRFVAVARRAEDLHWLQRRGWIPVTSPTRFRVWTDDFSNLLSVFH